MPTIQDLDNDIISPYCINALSEEHEALLRRICMYVTNSLQKEPFSKADEFRFDWEKDVHDEDVWDGRIFQMFLLDMFPEKLDVFKGFLSKRGVNFGGNFKKMSSGGIGEKPALTLFCSASEALGKPLVEYLKDYVIYCKKHEFAPRSFKLHKNTVDDILSEDDDVRCDDSPPNHSINIQDKLALNKEIEKIKTELKLYPYVKDNISGASRDKQRALYSKVTDLLSMFPNNAELVKLDIWFSLFYLSEPDKALKQSLDINGKHPNDLSTINYVVSCYSALKDLENMMLWAKKAHKIDRCHPLPLARIAQCHELSGEYEEAVAAYKRAGTLDEYFIFPKYRLALCYKALGHNNLHIATLRNALKYSPDNLVLLTELFRTLSSLDEEERHKILLKIINLGYSDKVVLQELFDIEDKSSDDVLHLYEKVIDDLKINPFSNKKDIAGVVHYYGRHYEALYFQKEKRKQYYQCAHNCFLEAMELAPDTYEHIESLSRSCFFMGDLDESKRLLIKASKAILATNSNLLNFWKPYASLHAYLKMDLKSEERNIPLEWCLEDCPDCLFAYGAIAQDLIESERYASAKEIVLRACDNCDISSDHEVSVGRANELQLIGDCIIALNKQDNFDNKWLLDKAITAYEATLTQTIKIEIPNVWYRSKLRLGEALNAIGGENGDTDTVNLAINNLESLSTTKHMLEKYLPWIDSVNALANSHKILFDITKNEEYLHKSIEYMEQYINLMDGDQYPDALHCANTKIAQLNSELGDLRGKE